METLEEIKDEAAASRGYQNFADLFSSWRGNLSESILNEISELYATEKAKEAWDRACKAQRVKCLEAIEAVSVISSEESESTLTAPLAEYNEK